MTPSRRFSWIFWIAILSMLTVPTAAHTVLRNLEYAQVDGISLRLDLYLPEEPSEVPMPLVIWVHGGGWRAGSKNGTYAPETLGSSYAVASVDYRLSDIETFPAQIHDVKAAVRWLRANAAAYGIDSDRFGAWGSSAGGHLVALLGTTCGHSELEGDLGNHLGTSSCVQAVCDFYGPTDFLALLEQRGDNVRRPMPEDQLLGGQVEELRVLAQLASPISHVNAHASPFLIMHGTEDTTVPLAQSTAFHDALLAAGATSTLITIEGAGHGFPREHLVHVKPFFDAWLQRSKTATSTENVFAVHRSGQTFVTWEETGCPFYAVYRCDTPIEGIQQLCDIDCLAVVPAGSSRNAHASSVERKDIYYVIEPGGPALDPNRGLLVHTTGVGDEAYYGVLSCTSAGELLDWIGSVGPVTERVDTPQPLRQSEEVVGDHVRAHYVHWAPPIDTSAAQALCNRPYLAFDFVIWEPAVSKPSGAALFSLHGGGGTYANAVPPPSHPGLFVVSPESVIPGGLSDVDRPWDAWYGYNSNVGLGAPLADGLNVDYTTRRLRWMAEWLIAAYPSIDPNRLFLRGSSMGGVGTVFSAIMLRDVFAAGIAIVPRFDYGADDVFLESFETFGTRWGSIEANVMTTDGIGVFDRLDASYLAQTHPEWDFAPVWAFNGRNDTAVGWSEKIPFYKTLSDTLHGWAFYWDLRAHGGRSAYPRAWRESGWEDAAFAWMVDNVRLDQSYPAFGNCSIDDNPGSGDPLDGDPIGTINGYLQWNPESIRDDSQQWSVEIVLHPDAPEASCYVDILPRRLRVFNPSAGERVRYSVRSIDGSVLMNDVAELRGWLEVDEIGRPRLTRVPITKQGVRVSIIDTTP